MPKYVALVHTVVNQFLFYSPLDLDLSCGSYHSLLNLSCLVILKIFFYYWKLPRFPFKPRLALSHMNSPLPAWTTEASCNILLLLNKISVRYVQRPKKHLLSTHGLPEIYHRYLLISIPNPDLSAS